MSTDYYFDFVHPEADQAYRDLARGQNWPAWAKKVRELDYVGICARDICWAADLKLLIWSDGPLWLGFRAKWHGKVLAHETLVNELVSDWVALCASICPPEDPPVSEDPGVFDDPVLLKKKLMPQLGTVFYTRLD